MIASTAPIVSVHVGTANGVLHRSLEPLNDSIEYLFLHLQADGERLTLVLLPHEVRDIRELLNVMFAETSGEEADHG